MKICTACNASYSDETLIFCPVDGTTLTPQKDISLDQVPYSYEMSDWSDKEASASGEANSFTHSEPPVTAAFSQPPPSAPQNPPSVMAKNTTGGFMFPVIVVGLVILALIGAFMFSITRSSGSGSTKVRVTPAGNTATLANGARVRAEPVGTPMISGSGNATVTDSPNYANTGKPLANTNVPVKPISRTTNFTGIWTGKFNEEATILSITTQNGDTFSGTLSKKGYVVKFSGKVDFDKGTVVIKETDVLQTPPNLKWYLGTNNGTIFDDGKSMGGTGKDANESYSWSFTKQ